MMGQMLLRYKFLKLYLSRLMDFTFYALKTIVCYILLLLYRYAYKKRVYHQKRYPKFGERIRLYLCIINNISIGVHVLIIKSFEPLNSSSNYYLNAFFSLSNYLKFLTFLKFTFLSYAFASHGSFTT